MFSIGRKDSAPDPKQDSQLQGSRSRPSVLGAQVPILYVRHPDGDSHIMKLQGG